MEQTEKKDREYGHDAGRYMEEKECFSLLRGLLHKIVVNRPADPIEFLIKTLNEPSVMKLFLLGPPFAGKRTQCEKIAPTTGMVHIAVSRLIDDAIAHQTDLGKQAETFAKNGGDVSDEVMINLICERAAAEDCRLHGFLLEGFPQTRPQALALQTKGIIPDRIITLDVDDTELMRRFVKSGKADSEQKMREDLTEFRHAWRGVVQCYGKEISHVDGTQEIEGVFNDIVKFAQLREADAAPKTHRIALVGPPGAGLSTQARNIAERYDVVLVNPRDVLKVEVAAQSALGKRAAQFLDDDILPDDLCLLAVVKRLLDKDCVQKGWVLDGFPLDAYGAQELEGKRLIPTRVIFFKIESIVATSRLTGLRVDPVTGKAHHLQRDEIPDEVRMRLKPRPQWKLEAVQARDQLFQDRVGGVLDVYAPILQDVDATQPVGTVRERVFGIIDRPLPPTQPQKKAAHERPRTAGSVAALQDADAVGLRSPRHTPRAADAIAGKEGGVRASAVQKPIKLVSEDELLKRVGSKMSAVSDQTPADMDREGTLRVCIVGPPGAGKTTQAEVIARRYQLVHIKPHELLAKEVERGTKLGKHAEHYINAVKMPDDILLEVIKNRVSAQDARKRGWVLDGFPENEWTAEHLHENGVDCNRYIVLSVSDKVATERLRGRCVDELTYRIYHRTFDPPPAEIEGHVSTFEEDDEPTIASRLVQYHRTEHGAHDFHSDVFFHVNGEVDVESVAQLVEVGILEPPLHAHQKLIEDLHSGLRVLVLGPPGSGVTTQAAVLADKLQVGLVSPHMTLKEAVATKTELGLRAAPFMGHNKTVPDDLLLEAVHQRLQDEDCSDGWVMDGFPASKPTAQALAGRNVRPHRVVLLESSDRTTFERAASGGRDAGEYSLLVDKYRRDAVALERYFRKIIVAVDNTSAPVSVSDDVEAALLSNESSSNLKIVLTGPPSAGCEIYAQMLADAHNLPLVFPPKILAQEMTAGSELGHRAEKYVGQKVPDDVVLDAVRSCLSEPDYENGWVLACFPNSVATADVLLAEDYRPHKVVVLEMSDATAVQRCARLGGDPARQSTELLEYRNTINTVLALFKNDVVRVEADSDDKDAVCKAIEDALVAQTTNDV